MNRRGVIAIIFALMWLANACSEKVGEKEYFNLASKYMEEQNWQKAEEYFGKICEEHPNGLFSSKALFMVGYINANHLKDFEKAREYYTEFLSKYPDHELAVAAKYELDNLGKGLDELPFLQDTAGSDQNKSDAVAQ